MTCPIVTTTGGRIRGTVEHGVHVFRGIPYAEPPVGGGGSGRRCGAPRGPACSTPLGSASATCRTTTRWRPS